MLHSYGDDPPYNVYNTLKFLESSHLFSEDFRLFEATVGFINLRSSLDQTKHTIRYNLPKKVNVSHLKKTKSKKIARNLV